MPHPPWVAACRRTSKFLLHLAGTVACRNAGRSPAWLPGFRKCDWHFRGACRFVPVQSLIFRTFPRSRRIALPPRSASDSWRLWNVSSEPHRPELRDELPFCAGPAGERRMWTPEFGPPQVGASPEYSRGAGRFPGTTRYLAMRIPPASTRHAGAATRGEIVQERSILLRVFTARHKEVIPGRWVLVS